MDEKVRMLVRGQRALNELPESIVRLSQIFYDAGEEIALVGGPVRDAFLGLPVHDFDLTTSARPEKTEKLLSQWGNTWDIGREFGTVGAHNNGITVEVTTYRSESYEVGSRKPDVEFGDTLEGDLTRRDFTVNAMAVRLPHVELIDPCGGMEDLKAGILRTPVSPAQSFDDDPLRIMRAARFAAQLSFDVEENVLKAMKEFAPRLKIVSQERIRSELERLMISPDPRRGIELMVNTEVAEYVIPEVSALRDMEDEQGRHKSHKDVYEHSLKVLDNALAWEKEKILGDDEEFPFPNFTLRFAALIHDIGKPSTRKFEKNGTVTFRWHDVVGARMATQRMQELRFDKKTTKDVARLVELHLRTFGFADSDWTDSAVRRFVRDAGELLPMLLRLIRADLTSKNVRKVKRLNAANTELVRRIRELKEKEELEAVRPDIDGNDIMQILDISPGREVGEAYKFMLDLRLEEGPLEREEAIARLKEWWANR